MSTTAAEKSLHRKSFGFHDIPSFERLDGSESFSQCDPFGDQADVPLFGDDRHPQQRRAQEKEKRAPPASSSDGVLMSFQVATSNSKQSRRKATAKSQSPNQKRPSAIQQWNHLVTRLELLDPSSSFHSTASRNNAEEEQPASINAAGKLVSTMKKTKKQKETASLEKSVSSNNNRLRQRRQSMPNLITDAQAILTKQLQRQSKKKKTVKQTISDLTMPSFEEPRKKAPRRRRHTTLPVKSEQELEVDSLSESSEEMEADDTSDLWSSPVSNKGSNKVVMVDRSPRPPVRYTSKEMSVCSWVSNQPTKQKHSSSAQLEDADDPKIEKRIRKIIHNDKVVTPPKPPARQVSRDPSVNSRPPTSQIHRTATSSTIRTTSISSTTTQKGGKRRPPTAKTSKSPPGFKRSPNKPVRNTSRDTIFTVSASSPKLSIPRKTKKEERKKTTQSERGVEPMQRSGSTKRKVKVKNTGTPLNSTRSHSNAERGRESSTSSHGTRKRQQKRIKSCQAERRMSRRSTKALDNSCPSNLTASRRIDGESPRKSLSQHRTSSVHTSSSGVDLGSTTMPRSRHVASRRASRAPRIRETGRVTPRRMSVGDADSTGYSSVRSLHSIQERRGRGNAKASQSIELRRSLRGLDDSGLLMPPLVKSSKDTRPYRAKTDTVWGRRKHRSTGSIQSLETSDARDDA